MEEKKLTKEKERSDQGKRKQPEEQSKERKQKKLG